MWIIFCCFHWSVYYYYYYYYLLCLALFLLIWGLSLPCHLLCLFVFYLRGYFLVSLIALDASSVRLVMSALAVGCIAPPLRNWASIMQLIRKPKKRALSEENECCTLKKRLTTGLGGWCQGAGRCPIATPLAGHAGPIWEMTSIVYIYIYILLKIHGYYWQDVKMAKSVSRSTVTGLEWRGQGPHMLWPSQGGFSRCNT